MSLHIPSTTDIVFIDTLRLSANIGADCWGKPRDQPIHISVYLHFNPSFLKAAGETDDVLDSVHYGHLTKSISTLVQSTSHFHDELDGLVKRVAEEAFTLAGNNAQFVRVVVDAPKLILLAKTFTFDAIVSRVDKQLKSRKVTVSELTIPVIIGVNPPEREAKQRVRTDLVFYQKEGTAVSHVEYQRIINTLSKEIEISKYLTLEKFVHEVALSALLASDWIEAITVRAQKPSALSFAEYSGVEITLGGDPLLKPLKLKPTDEFEGIGLECLEIIIKFILKVKLYTGV